MGRTPLHYAMGCNRVDEIGHSLIKHGANRIVRDVVMINSLIIMINSLIIMINSLIIMINSFIMINIFC